MAGIKKVIVLGATGMLGSMTYNYLSLNKKLKVIGTTRKISDKEFKFFDALEFNSNPQNFKFIKNADFIINTVGLIKPFCKGLDGAKIATEINSLFPYNLAIYLQGNKHKTKIINIATDCVYSGKEGKYNEASAYSATDIYDKSKNLGEVESDNFLNIRCSIIGPQNNHSENLMQWFLNQNPKSVLNGYSDHYWNGVTTLQFAQLMEKIITTNKFSSLRKENHIHHFTPNNVVTKYQLLTFLNTTFAKNFKINKVKSPSGKLDRSLTTNFKGLSKLSKKTTIEAEIINLKNFMDSYER